MFSRSVQSPSSTVLRAITPRPSRRYPVSRFSHNSRQTQQHEPPSPRPDEYPKGRNGKHHHPPRGSVRPFTVLFLCIPLGYGASWALKSQKPQASPDGFIKYSLASKEEVSSTCSVFTLEPTSPASVLDVNAPGLERAITSVQFKQPQLQIARSYTLLPPLEGDNAGCLRFLIRKERNGEVSGYLHRLPVDAEIEVRGINKEYIVPSDVREVLFLAGGTGVAPALQMANILKDQHVDVHLLWANRRREDCVGGVSDAPTEQGTAWWNISRLWSSNSTQLTQTIRSDSSSHQIVRQLDDMKATAGQRLQVDYFVDEESTFIKPGHVAQLTQNTTPGRKLLVVSGPEGFVNYWAGPKEWSNGREVQGPLGGVLRSMDTAGWDVVKM